MIVDDLWPIRIGELSRRTGISVEVLRAWERRYGLLHPARSRGRFRLYGWADEQRAMRTKSLIECGVSTAEAARTALIDTTPAIAMKPASSSGELAGMLDEALAAFDGDTAHRTLDRLMGTLSLEGAIEDVLIPALARIGTCWAAGDVSVAQEHFASNLLRTRLTLLAVGWDQGGGPRALMACPPGEAHDFGLLACGVILHRFGWRITYLGQDTPVADLAAAAEATRPALVVVAAADPGRFEAIRGELADLAATRRVAIAGAGATAAFAASIGAAYLSDGPLEAARTLSQAAFTT